MYYCIASMQVCIIHCITRVVKNCSPDHVHSYGTDYSPFVLDEVDCSDSSYLVLLQCSYSTIIDSSCIEDYDDVTVSCCKCTVTILYVFDFHACLLVIRNSCIYFTYKLHSLLRGRCWRRNSTIL